MQLLIEVIWFLLPAGFANLVPPIAARLFPRWDRPLDFGVCWRGQQLLGSHKTVRGVVTGTLVASVVHQLQVMLALGSEQLTALAVSPAYYQIWWLGAWLGFTALLGDAIKSLIKRRLQVAPGQPWLPWDKVDWVFGCLAGSWFLLPLSVGFCLLAIATGMVLSSLGRLVGYWLHINDEWL